MGIFQILYPFAAWWLIAPYEFDVGGFGVRQAIDWSVADKFRTPVAPSNPAVSYKCGVGKINLKIQGISVKNVNTSLDEIRVLNPWKLGVDFNIETTVSVKTMEQINSAVDIQCRITMKTQVKQLLQGFTKLEWMGSECAIAECQPTKAVAEKQCLREFIDAVKPKISAQFCGRSLLGFGSAALPSAAIGELNKKFGDMKHLSVSVYPEIELQRKVGDAVENNFKQPSLPALLPSRTTSYKCQGGEQSERSMKIFQPWMAAVQVDTLRKEMKSPTEAEMDLTVNATVYLDTDVPFDPAYFYYRQDEPVEYKMVPVPFSFVVRTSAKLVGDKVTWSEQGCLTSEWDASFSEYYNIIKPDCKDAFFKALAPQVTSIFCEKGLLSKAPLPQTVLSALNKNFVEHQNFEQLFGSKQE